MGSLEHQKPDAFPKVTQWWSGEGQEEKKGSFDRVEIVQLWSQGNLGLNTGSATYWHVTFGMSGPFLHCGFLICWMRTISTWVSCENSMREKNEK